MTAERSTALKGCGVFLTRLEQALTTALAKAIEEAETAGLRIDGSGEYSHMPTGYDKDHARGKLLKKKGIVTISPTMGADVITSPALADVCFDHAKSMLPLHQWLAAMQQG